MTAHVAAWLWANCAGNLVASAITATLAFVFHRRVVRREIDRVHRRLDGHGIARTDDDPGRSLHRR